MKLAKCYNEKKILGRSVTYIGSQPTEAEIELFLEGKAIEGDANNVVNIGFYLDIGDISGEIDGSERKKVLSQLWTRFNIEDNERELFFKYQRKDLEKLISAAKEGMDIRIWTSHAPYSVCGFYYVCYLLRNIDCKIRVVSLPQFISFSNHEIIECSHWAEIKPGQFYQFLNLEKPLSSIEKQYYSQKWQDLVLENAPLRAVINGKLTSVEESFYDFIIINNLPDNDFLMGQLIGKLLGKYKLGISDAWYALRIDKMIEENKLKLVEIKDTSYPYGKLLRKI